MRMRFVDEASDMAMERERLANRMYSNCYGTQPMRRIRKKPVVTIRFGAASQTIEWDGQSYDFTNGDERSLTLLAENVCKLTGIGVIHGYS